MIRKKRPLLLAAIIVLALAGLSLSTFSFAQDEEMLLNTGIDISTQRSPVVFSHDLHMGLYECLDCHHDMKDGTNVLDEDALEEGNPDIQCGNCHNDQASLDLQKAYHRQCMGCHIDNRKAGNASGPEMCGACHLPAS
jgi:c(7)-type cytochrome triheme protein